MDFRFPVPWRDVNQSQGDTMPDHTVSLLDERDRSIEDAIGALQGNSQGNPQAAGGDTFSAGGVASFTVDPLPGWTGQPPGGFWIVYKVLDASASGLVLFYTSGGLDTPLSLYVDASVGPNASGIAFFPGYLWNADILTCEATSDGVSTDTGSTAGIAIYW